MSPVRAHGYATNFAGQGAHTEVVSTLSLRAPPASVYAYLVDHVHMKALSPWWIGLEVLSANESASGLVVNYRMRAYGVPFIWRTIVDLREPPSGLGYRQERGPYARWEHVQHIRSVGDGTHLESRIVFGLRGPALVRAVLEPIARWHIRSILAHRAKVLRRVTEDKDPAPTT